MIRVRVIKADDLEATLRRARFSAAVVVWSDEEPPAPLQVGDVVERGNGRDGAVPGAEQDAAALVGVGRHAVRADLRARLDRKAQRRAGRAPEGLRQVARAAIGKNRDDASHVQGARDLE